jgi:hypothetical protein
VFNRIFAELAAKGGKPDQLMIDATHLKAHRTAASKSPLSQCVRRTNPKLHFAITSLKTSLPASAHQC